MSSECIKHDNVLKVIERYNKSLTDFVIEYIFHIVMKLNAYMQKSPNHNLLTDSLFKLSTANLNLQTWHYLLIRNLSYYTYILAAT